MIAVQVVFWLAVAALLLHYIGYPLVLALLARLRQQNSVLDESYLPPVTLLISAYNEERVIGQRMENCLGLDYPREKLRIIVVSDGSTDKTHAIVKSYSDQGIELMVVHGRGGKTAALNQVVPKLESEIVVFTDANSMLRPDALRKLVRHFAEERVGAVCGELQLVDTENNAARAEGFYWRYEKFIKQMESKVSTLTVVNGALYALRRQLHGEMDPRAANDFQHPLQVVRQGYVCQYEPEAVATEETPADSYIEFRRRVRIVARGWRGLASNLWVLIPWQAGTFTLQFVCRKLLRWLGPVFLIASLTANLALWSLPFYRLFLMFQAVFYGAAAVGCATRVRPFWYAWYFCLINYGALLGLFAILIGRNTSVWTPTTHSQVE